MYINNIYSINNYMNVNQLTSNGSHLHTASTRNHSLPYTISCPPSSSSDASRAVM